MIEVAAQQEQYQDNFLVYSHDDAFLHMTRYRPEKEQNLYIKTDEALFHIWDANCVSIDDSYREEYLAYLPHLFDLLLETEDGAEIIDYLLYIEETYFGIRKGDNLALERACRLTDVLLQYKNDLM